MGMLNIVVDKLFLRPLAEFINYTLVDCAPSYCQKFVEALYTAVGL